MKVLLAQINPIVGDLSGNTQKILNSIEAAKKASVQFVLFPELALTGYPAKDLLLLPSFIDQLPKYLKEIEAASDGLTVIVGTPRKVAIKAEKHLFNSAAIFSHKKLVGYQDKWLLPTYDVFDERRYFEPGSEIKLWDLEGKKVAVTICEDIWQHSQLLQDTNYLRDPIEELKRLKPDLVFNLSASPYSIAKGKSRLKVCQKAASTLKSPLFLANQVGGNDELIFDGRSLWISAEGKILAEAKAFEEEDLILNLSGNAQGVESELESIEGLYQALVLGTRDYFVKSGFKKACLGVSGGIDSAVVACIAADALGAENLLGIAMPSRYSSESSVKDARDLANNLNMQLKEISIEKPFQAYLEMLQPFFADLPFNETEENIQARIRGGLLMAFSNKFGYIVLSTGNKSELALGYSTLYGDMVGGLGVINDVTKRQVYALAAWINRHKEIIPKNTILKPPSAELRPNQKDSDSLPEYEIIDNVVESYVESHLSAEKIAKKFNYPLETAEQLIARIHKNEYKRRQSPPGLRVTEKSFAVGREFPIVQRWIT